MKIVAGVKKGITFALPITKESSTWSDKFKKGINRLIGSKESHIDQKFFERLKSKQKAAKYPLFKSIFDREE